MRFSRAMLCACLTALAALLMLAASLLAVLVAVQYLRGDAEANPLIYAVICVGSAVFGVIARIFARRLEEPEDD